jgi:hypothetical protein
MVIQRRPHCSSVWLKSVSVSRVMLLTAQWAYRDFLENEPALPQAQRLRPERRGRKPRKLGHFLRVGVELPKFPDWVVDRAEHKLATTIDAVVPGA